MLTKCVPPLQLMESTVKDIVNSYGAVSVILAPVAVSRLAEPLTANVDKQVAYDISIRVAFSGFGLYRNQLREVLYLYIDYGIE